MDGKQKFLFQITQSRKEYKILLVPAHVGITGNKVADRIDKNTTNKKDIMDILVSKGEGKTGMMGKWQERWKLDNTC